MKTPFFSRRDFAKRLTVGAACASAAFAASAKAARFQFKFIVGSSIYGELPLAEILPDVRRTGAGHIDIWPRVHGNQREQMEEMGHEKFAAMLERHQVRLSCLTHYDLGPFKLQAEMRVGQKFGNQVVICGGSGPKKLKGAELKAAVKKFAEQMKPHIAVAEETNTIIGVENHGNNLIDSPDSLRWLIELAPSKHIGVALAPYHLESLGMGAKELASLIVDLKGRMPMFYAWQHGMGCATKLPKAQELLQMPGRGELDFQPIVDALKQIDYDGFTEIFMHPVPRGIPILPSASEVTAEINRARGYLESMI